MSLPTSCFPWATSASDPYMTFSSSTDSKYYDVVFPDEPEAAYDIFEDTIRVLEQITEMPEDESGLNCTSPALKEFTLKTKFYWSEENGKEYKYFYTVKNEWCNCIVPLDLQKSLKESWFDSIRADHRLDKLFERFDNCVISRDKEGY